MINLTPTAAHHAPGPVLQLHDLGNIIDSQGVQWISLEAPIW